MSISTNKRVRQSMLVLGLSVLTVACGVRARKSITDHLPQSKYRSVIVLVFKSADANPLMGQAAADAMSASLGRLGFTVVDREFARRLATEKGISSNPTIEELRTLAKELGVSGYVQGTVSESGERQEQVAATLETRNQNYNAWGNPTGSEIYAKGPSTQTISKFSASASLTDVQNGSVVWSGSLSDSFTNSTVQAVANSVMERMALSLGKRLVSTKS